MNKIAFVCETPYHLTNAIKIISGISEFRNADIYLFIGNKFLDAKKVCRSLETLNIFKGVVLYDYNNIKNKYYARFLELFFPSKYISLLSAKSPFLSLDFDCILLPSYLYFGLGLLRVNLRAKYCMFEDGLATYFGVEVKGVYSRFRRLIWWLQNVDRNHLTPSILFLNIPELYENYTDSNFCIKKIPDFITGIDTILYSIFNFIDNQLYQKYNLIYLSQPFFKNKLEGKNIIRRNNILQSVFAITNGDILLRYHPREKISKNIKIESENTQNWELTSFSFIDNEKILLTPYSTAAFVPKFLYNKEPYIVFLYKLFEYPDYINPRIETMISKLRDVYFDKNKIIIIDNIDDLDDTLKFLTR